MKVFALDILHCPHRELATLLTLSESIAEVGLEPLTLRSMHKNLTSELSILTPNIPLDRKIIQYAVLTEALLMGPLRLASSELPFQINNPDIHT